MKWIDTIVDKWKAFRTWQIGDCTQAAGQGDKTLGKEFFRGTIDSALPFLSGETFHTLVQLLFRPGYMIREFLRGKDNHILSPMTAMIIFFALQLLLTNMVVTDDLVVPGDVYETVKQKIEDSEDFPKEEEWETQFALQIVSNMSELYYLTHLDQYPENVDNHAEQVLAGVEGWLRGQGVFLFFSQLMLLAISLWIVGRRYRLTFSAAASIAAYMLCQLCFFNTVLILFTLGGKQMIPFWLIVLLLFENIYQLLGIGFKRTSMYVILLLLVMSLLVFIAFLIFAGAVSYYAYGQM